jgi:aerobic-type carbon monoxide dehydrogenase small subunit (CoxS/CutS family)
MPGGVDLGNGWSRNYEASVCYDPKSVAAYLKGHPDAEGAHITTTEIIDGKETVVQLHIAEKTMLGWIVSIEPMDEPEFDA